MNKIKAYTGYEEATNTFYSRMFKILSDIPEVGDLMNGEEVKQVDPLTMDYEQPTAAAHQYNYFKVTTTINKEYDPIEGDFDEEYIAVLKPGADIDTASNY
jgi:hypothetical protein